MENNVRYQVIVSAQAERALMEHTRFLAKVSKPAANRLVDDFLELVSSLEQSPERFPVFIHNGIHL